MWVSNQPEPAANCLQPRSAVFQIFNEDIQMAREMGVPRRPRTQWPKSIPHALPRRHSIRHSAFCEANPIRFHALRSHGLTQKRIRSIQGNLHGAQRAKDKGSRRTRRPDSTLHHFRQRHRDIGEKQRSGSRGACVERASCTWVAANREGLGQWTNGPRANI